MAGHSKWANIKHKKKAVDAKRGKIFTKLIREITVAARMGGADVDSNPRLRSARAAAFAANMPKDTVERAIKRGAGGEEGSNIEEIRYEGYGPAGVAVMVDCMTDNRNRTVAEVRHAFSKSGGNLGTDGSVAYLFSKQGMIALAADADEEKVLEVALDAGAEDVQTNEDGTIEVATPPEICLDISETLEKAGFEVLHTEVMMVASTETTLDKEQAEKVMRLVDMLEDLDDVQAVHTNADISAEIMDQLD